MHHQWEETGRWGCGKEVGGDLVSRRSHAATSSTTTAASLPVLTARKKYQNTKVNTFTDKIRCTMEGGCWEDVGKEKEEVLDL